MSAVNHRWNVPAINRGGRWKRAAGGKERGPSFFACGKPSVAGGEEKSMGYIRVNDPINAHIGRSGKCDLWLESGLEPKKHNGQISLELNNRRLGFPTNPVSSGYILSYYASLSAVGLSSKKGSFLSQIKTVLPPFLRVPLCSFSSGKEVLEKKTALVWGNSGKKVSVLSQSHLFFHFPLKMLKRRGSNKSQEFVRRLKGGRGKKEKRIFSLPSPLTTYTPPFLLTFSGLDLHRNCFQQKRRLSQTFSPLSLRTFFC